MKASSKTLPEQWKTGKVKVEAARRVVYLVFALEYKQRHLGVDVRNIVAAIRYSSRDAE